MSRAKMSNICSRLGTTIKICTIGMQPFFFRRKTKSSLIDFIVELAAPPLFVCTSATFIMEVLAGRPMMILIQSVELMRSDAFKKPWSGVVETEGLIRKGSLYEVKFFH